MNTASNTLDRKHSTRASPIREGYVSQTSCLDASACNRHHPRGDINPVHLASGTDLASQADQRMTRSASDLQHSMAGGHPKRLKADVTGGVFARVGYQIVRAADPIIEISRPALRRSSCRHDPG
jgi:hypothetical protein